MENKYLIINAGSSSLKFALYDEAEEKQILSGNVEKIGESTGVFSIKTELFRIKREEQVKDHNQAVNIMIRELLDNNFIQGLEEIKGIGHRILHGGEFYSDSVIIDDSVIENIKSLVKLGPLHLPSELEVIEVLKKLIPEIPMVAVFDTAFHQTIPEENYLYAVPYEWYKEYGVRKYGFHGISYKYITEVMKQELNKQNPNMLVWHDPNMVACHLGNGTSITEIKDGKSINNSMGLTPLDGLVMGTRSGTIDPSIIEYICKEKNITVEEAINILNKKSGLLGLCGKNDLRDINNLVQEGNSNAKLAFNKLVNSACSYIYQYYGDLKETRDIDAIVFTAGAGENNQALREAIVNKISNTIGCKLNREENDKIAGFKEKQEGIITTEDSSVPIYVIPTNEEYQIYKDVYNLVNKKEKTKTRKKIK